MQLGHWLAPNGFGYLYLTKALLALASLTIPWAGYRIGRLISPVHGLFTAFVLVIWFEFLYFSTQALTETFALYCFFPAAALLLAPDEPRRHVLVLGGLLLAMAAILRFQYGPALAVFGIMACGRSLTRWVWVGAGALLAALLSAGVDLWVGMTPFSWLLANVHHNITLQRSYAWTEPGWYYLRQIVFVLAPWILLQLYLAWHPARRFPALAAAALVNLVVHSLVAHKEYRYVLLSTAIIILLAALGTVDRVYRTRATPPEQKRGFQLAIAFWIVASALCAVNGTNRWIWSIHRPELLAFQSLHTDGAACGVALYGRHWSETGGYSYLHRPLPLYVIDDQKAGPLRAAQPAYNIIFAPRHAALDIPAIYKRDRCFAAANGPGDDICLYRRPGSCAPAVGADYEFNAWLKRNDL